MFTKNVNQKVPDLVFYMKKVIDKCSPFRPILSEIKTSSYNLAKLLVSLIEPITKKHFTVINNFAFSNEICKQNSEYYIARLDVESLFTSIQSEETIKICFDSL